MRSLCAALACFLCGCYFGANPSHGDAGGDDAGGICVQIPLPDGGPVHVTGMVVEPDGVTPVANAIIGIEYGGLYLPWCDLAHASPYYLFGAVSGADGKFEVDVRNGMLGFHSFASGYYYSRASLDTTTGATTVVITTGHLLNGQGVPSVSAMGFDSATAAPGAQVTFSAKLATWSPNDPLSDENIIVQPTQSFGVELDPPALGSKDDFPDGVWKRTITAPTTPGIYTYYFSATTAGCITSNVVSATLTVQ